MKNHVRIINVNKWSEYLDHVGSMSGEFFHWAFRGHADAEWPLWSTLSRRFQAARIPQNKWTSAEERSIRIFKRKAHLFLSHIPELDDDFQWLSIIQHYGGPTRLIDFTWSPYIAAFFALEQATKDAAVWAVCTTRMPNVTCGGQLRSAKVFRRTVMVKPTDRVWYGEPYVMNTRLTAQRATFIVPGKTHEPVDFILGRRPSGESLIAKFVFRTETVRDDAMNSLYRMNVTYNSLFPDLEGLARSLGYEMEFAWAFDRAVARQSGEAPADPHQASADRASAKPIGKRRQTKHR